MEPHVEIKHDIIIIDNWLPEEQLREMVEEGVALFGDPLDNTEDELGNGVRFTRVYVDDVYPRNRHESRMLSAIDNKMFDLDMRKRWAKIDNGSYQYALEANFHESQLTSYSSGDEYDWHQDIVKNGVDTFSGRCLNFIYHMCPEEKQFEGGELEVCTDMTDFPDDHSNIIRIQPKRNRLIIMPSYYWHRVRMVSGINCNVCPMEARVTLNGHIGFRV